MTPDEAKEKGYEIIAASAFEVGLLKDGKGVRCWWARDFDGKIPSFDHPLIQEAIRITESYDDWIRTVRENMQHPPE